jgi:hypothetical protein
MASNEMPSPRRRELIKMLGALPFGASFGITPVQAESASLSAQTAGADYAPKFFSESEWKTVRVLSDMVIPRDDRSGGATDAGVPEFMDFVLVDPLAEPRQRERNQVRMRGGLAWLERESRTRFQSRSFVEASQAERTALLDDIAYSPEGSDPAPPEDEAGGEPLAGLEHGRAFFNAFRDLTASGFWSSRMGVEDIGYQGNRYVALWNGCPPEVLEKLGLKPR